MCSADQLDELRRHQIHVALQRVPMVHAPLITDPLKSCQLGMEAEEVLQGLGSPSFGFEKENIQLWV